MPDWDVLEETGRRLSIDSSPKLETTWRITHTEDEVLALSRLIARTPDVLNDTSGPFLLRSGIPDLHEIGPDLWEARVIYGVTPFPQDGEFIISGGTTNGRQTMTQAFDIYDAVAIDKSSPVWDLSIGVDAQGNAQGVEVPMPSPHFSIEVWIELEAFSYSYQHFLEVNSGRVFNSDTFFGRDPWTTRFVDCTYSGRKEFNPDGDELMRLKFNFEVGENFLYDPDAEAEHDANFPSEPPLLTGIRLPGMTRPLSKRAWDHLDVREETIVLESEPPPEDKGRVEDTTNHVPTKWKVRRPVMARSMVVLRELDFALFGIGTG